MCVLCFKVFLFNLKRLMVEEKTWWWWWWWWGGAINPYLPLWYCYDIAILAKQTNRNFAGCHVIDPGSGAEGFLLVLKVYLRSGEPPCWIFRLPWKTKRASWSTVRTTQETLGFFPPGRVGQKCRVLLSGLWLLMHQNSAPVSMAYICCAL